jgi:hypothetical protein
MIKKYVCRFLVCALILLTSQFNFAIAEKNIEDTKRPRAVIILLEDYDIVDENLK